MRTITSYNLYPSNAVVYTDEGSVTVERNVGADWSGTTWTDDEAEEAARETLRDLDIDDTTADSRLISWIAEQFPRVDNELDEIAADNDDIVSIRHNSGGEIEIEVWAKPDCELGPHHVICAARDKVAELLGARLRDVGYGDGDGTKIGIFEIVKEEMMMTQSLHDRVVEHCENAACSVAQNDWDALAYYHAAAAQAAEFLGQRIRLDSGTELAGVLGDMALDAISDENVIP